MFKKEKLNRYLAITFISGVFIFPLLKGFIPLPDRPIEYFSDGVVQTFILPLKDYIAFFLTCMFSLWISDEIAKKNSCEV